MRIVFLHMTMGLVTRGSEVSTSLLATALSHKHEVMVIQSGRISKEAYLTKRVMPLEVAPPPAPTSIFEKVLFRLGANIAARQARTFTKLALPTIGKFRPDIVVAVNGADQVRVLQKASSTYKLVVFGRAGIGHDDLGNLAAVPDLFVALTPQARDWANEHKSGKTKIAYIPNPIDLKKYKGESYPHHLPSPVVLVVGALTGYKNIDVAVAAAKALSASLLLVGDGAESDQIAEQLSSYPTDFRWLKSVAPQDMPSLYQSADAFCFVPDPQEAFGRVYLEAMAAGLPIVASADPIRRGLIGSKGLFADPHDVSSVVGKLSQALKQGRVSYQKELKPYDIKTVTSSIEGELYAII
jgi:glycosyltransferase involved in cell wall biosynthesis